MAAAPSFTEHHIPQGQGKLYARDYAGAEPAFVLMHGFPDNLQVYDPLIPHLAAGGRRIVTFDFLGFGASEKPAAAYSFEQQMADLEAVVGHLGLKMIVPVAHDSSGIVSLDYALAHPERVASVAMLNSAYAEDDTVLWPEMITLFATGSLQALAMEVAQNPAQLGWLLTWQQRKFTDPLPDALKSGMQTIIGPLVERNFTEQPSAGPACVQMTTRFFEAQTRNAARAADLKALDIPVKLIWGQYDPYITVAVLYLSGKIDQWYVKPDQSGVVFILNVTEPADAKALLDPLPLSRAGLMTFQFIPFGPLSPLRTLLGAPSK